MFSFGILWYCVFKFSILRFISHLKAHFIIVESTLKTCELNTQLRGDTQIHEHEGEQSSSFHNEFERYKVKNSDIFDYTNFVLIAKFLQKRKKKLTYKKCS